MAQEPGYDIESARRRVFLVFAVFLLLAMLGDVFSEIDKPVNALDDAAIVLVSAVAIVLVMVVWKRQEPSIGIVNITMQNNALVWLFVLMIIVKLIGVYIELGTDDFGDEIPVIIGLVIAIVNRYV